MKGLNLVIFIAIAIVTTSCGSLIPANQAKTNYLPIDRSYYAESSIINKTLFEENKANEASQVKVKKEKTAIEELNDIHAFAMASFVTGILSEAESYLGVPYRYGGTSRSGIDCSAFVQRVFEIFDQDLPRISSAQAKEGHPVSKDELRAGDLIFFATNGGSRVSHVGIVHNVSDQGDVEFIHASTSKGVIVSPLSDAYWSKRYLYAKRLID